MMVYSFLDTSAILNGALKIYQNVYISPLVLMELENIKTSNKNKEIQYLARHAVRDIINSTNVTTKYFAQKAIDKKLKKYPFLMNINDHRLLCEAELLAEKENCLVNFITSDGALYLFSKRMPPSIEGVYYTTAKENTNKEEFCGWGKYYPTNDQLNLIYSNPEINILKCKTNEFAEIFVGNELKDILFWNGNQYTQLKYKDIKNIYTGEVIKPRNLEQKMALHLLQDENIKVKLLTSQWGSGKTLLALSYALEQVSRGKYQKIVFVRNNIVVADTNDIGHLPGDVRDKMAIWGQVIADHLGGQEMLDKLIDDGVIEIFPLSHIRGRSIRNSIIFCDECENLNDKLVTLLLSRVEENSEIIFCGDVAQIDSHKFEDNNGIRAMLTHLVGEPLFGTVKLIKSERGPVPRLCDLIRPPV